MADDDRDVWMAEIRDAVAAEKDWRRARVYEDTYRWRDATIFLLEELDRREED
jgi:hypothetical protein